MLEHGSSRRAIRLAQYGLATATKNCGLASESNTELK